MPFRAWLFAVAIGLVGAWPLEAQQQLEPPAQEQPATGGNQGEAPATSNDNGIGQQADAKDLAPALEGIESAIRDLIAEEDKIERERRIDQTGRDLSAQEGMSKWAYWMFVATAATVALTFTALIAIIRTLHHTRRAADSAAAMVEEAKATTVATQEIVRDTRSIGEAQVRAYLAAMFSRISIEAVENNDGPNFVVKVDLEISNSGSSPAYSVQVFYDIQDVAPNDVVPIPQPETMQDSGITASSIAANGTTNQILTRTWQVQNPTEILKLKDRLIRFSYAITFVDEFEKERWTPMTTGTLHHFPEGQISFLADKIRVQEQE